MILAWSSEACYLSTFFSHLTITAPRQTSQVKVSFVYCIFPKKVSFTLKLAANLVQPYEKLWEEIKTKRLQYIQLIKYTDYLPTFTFGFLLQIGLFFANKVKGQVKMKLKLNQTRLHDMQNFNKLFQTWKT